MPRIRPNESRRVRSSSQMMIANWPVAPPNASEKTANDALGVEKPSPQLMIAV